MYEVTGDLAALALFNLTTVTDGFTQVGQVTVQSGLRNDKALLYQVSLAYTL